MPYAGKTVGAHETVAKAVAAGSNAVRALRETIHYSVEDLAIACGLACSEIDELESGGSIDEAKLRRIANALETAREHILWLIAGLPCDGADRDLGLVA